MKTSGLKNCKITRDLRKGRQKEKGIQRERERERLVLTLKLIYKFLFLGKKKGTEEEADEREEGMKRSEMREAFDMYQTSAVSQDCSWDNYSTPGWTLPLFL